MEARGMRILAALDEVAAERENKARASRALLGWSAPRHCRADRQRNKHHAIRRVDRRDEDKVERGGNEDAGRREHVAQLAHPPAPLRTH